MGKRKPVVGLRFGALTVLEFVRDEFTSGNKIRPVYCFRCDCGVELERRIYSVTKATNPSCGCNANRHVTHGHSIGHALSPEYRAWRCMLTRAKNPRIKNAARYSLRGIGVAPEWDSGGDGKGFMRFLEHIGPKPSPTHSLDRIDNERGYEPNNVRWATVVEQVRNTSANTIISTSLGTDRLVILADKVGISPSIVSQRIMKLGWDHDRALLQPPKKDKRRIGNGSKPSKPVQEAML